jgi:hypothetical protein
MSATTIAVVELGGVRALVPLLDVPEDAPADVREGLARRNIVNAGGTCPCGATLTLPNRAARRRAVRAGTVLPAVAEHESSCPATTPNVIAAIRRWRAP